VYFKPLKDEGRHRAFLQLPGIVVVLSQEDITMSATKV